MKKINYAKTLDQAVSGCIPDSLDLKSKILGQITSSEKKRVVSARKLGKSMLVVILLLILLSITTIVYAIIQLSGGDPGIHSILQASLPATLNVTAMPKILPSATPPVKTMAPLKPGLSQVRSGVKLSIDSLYIDETRLELGLRFSTVPAGLRFGAPVVTFKNITPQQMRGSIEQSNNGTGWADYISYQVIHVDDVNGKLNLGLDVPLLQTNGVQTTALDNFHFDLQDVPIDRGQNGTRTQQTYFFKVNEIALSLESLRLDEDRTEAILCQEGSASPQITSATLQIDEGPKTAYQTQVPSGSSCSLLTFPLGSAENGRYLHLQVSGLAPPAPNNGTIISGPWDFTADLPGQPAASSSSISTAVPGGLLQPTQVVGNVSVTLDWVFADARRVAVGYTIRGLPDVPEAMELGGSIRLSDDKGQFLGAGIGSQSIDRVADQPGVLRGTYSVGFEKALTASQANFGLDLTLDSPQHGDNLGNFPVAPQATPYPPGVFPPLLPDHLIGTYHFNFSVPVYPLQVVAAQPPLKAGGLEMHLVRAEVTASFTEAMLCYQKPSAGDWGTFESVSIKNAAGDAASIQGARLIYDSNFQLPAKDRPLAAWSVPEDVKKWSDGRCVLVDFLLGHGNRSGEMALMVPDLQLTLPEVIPDDQIRAARQKLLAQGIDMDYTTMSMGGGGGGGPRYNKLPGGMSEEQAYRLFLEALGYVHSGPWNFTFNVSSEGAVPDHTTH